MDIVEVTMPPTQPRFDDGTNSCTNGRSTAISPATPMPTTKRQTERKIHPYWSGVRAMMPVAREKLSAVAINTLRRPMRSAIQPQKTAPGIAPTPAARRIVPDSRNVSFHAPTMSASTYPIRKKSKKSEHVADDRGRNDLPLVQR